MASCAVCAIGDVPLSQCSGCHGVTYCGTQCQARDWRNGHALTCFIGVKGEKRARAAEPSDIILEFNPENDRMLRYFRKFPKEAQHWLQNTGHDVRTQIETLRTAMAANKNFLVAPTSVAATGGFGLYSLRAYPPNTVLDITYPGIETTPASMKEILDTLAALSDRRTLAHRRAVEDPGDAIQTLYDNYGILIVEERGKDPDWKAIYDSFLAYRFDTLYWNRFYSSGGIAAQKNNSAHFALFFNEPSAYKQFYSRVRSLYEKKPVYQLSKANVDAIPVDADGKIRFITLRKIRVGEELLYDYGDAYAPMRKYDASGSVEGQFVHPDVMEEYYSRYVAAIL